MYNQEIEEFLNHNPLTEEEALGLLPNGNYDGYIRKVEIKSGKKNPDKRYFVATVEVFSNSGKLSTMITWLALDYMLKHMYDACDLSDKYKESKLSTKDCESKNVTVKIGTQDGNEQYPNPKNVVIDFLKPKDKPPTLTINGKSEEDFFNDPITF